MERPSLSGCYSRGDTREGAWANIHEAIEPSPEELFIIRSPPAPLPLNLELFTSLAEARVVIGDFALDDDRWP